MEALAAVGLAGNVVQFLDFSCNLFSLAKTIYNSQVGAPRGAQDLETVTESLLDFSARLEKSLDNQSLHGGSDAQQKLKILAKGCHNTSKELISILQRVRAKRARSKWHSFRASLTSLVKEAEINDLEKRLIGYRSQIVLELQDLQRRDYDEILNKLTEYEKRGQQTSGILSDQISAFKADMKNTLAMLVIELQRQDAQRFNGTRQDSRLNISKLAANLTHAGNSGTATLDILQELRFEGMSQRYTSVRKAHTGTFEWAFVNQLSDWLQSDDALFWVTGKPGSGKSTLMKRLADSTKTSLLLRKWSGAEEPVVASYFYWIKGTELQRSDVGLLRCVLHDYLRQCPLAMPFVFPTMWADNMAHVPRSDSIDWKREDLIQAFHRLADVDTKSAHLCLFIDGLDEYQGDHQDIIETIQYLSRLRIKICVASRPWNVFEETFGHLPQVRMQDLNKPDIEIYVRDCLFLRQDFQRARVASGDMDVIMSEITEKSQGVFLWVYLVVRSLVEGLRNLDPMSLLMKRLSSFPSDLNDFFHDMFQSLDPIYRDKTAKMFLLTLQTMSPVYTKGFEPTRLTTLTHWYLDELDDKPDLPLSHQATGCNGETIIEQSNTASLRINGRCKGLLEMVPGPFFKSKPGSSNIPYWYEVTFLHRTVADFFETPVIQQMLNEWLDENWASWSLICRATLAEIKAVLSLEPVDLRVDMIRPAATRFLVAASLHETSRGASLIPLLDDFSRALLGHQLCFPLILARLFAEYNLLIYVKASSSTQSWIQQPTSKLEVLEGDGRAALIYPIVVPRRQLTLQMICLIHSMGAMVKIGMNSQDHIAHARNEASSDEEYISLVRQLTRTAHLEIVRPGSDPNRAFSSVALHNTLVDIIGNKQTVELVDFCMQSAKKSHKNSKKMEKQNPFKNLFRRMR